MTDRELLFKAYNEVFSGISGEIVLADLIDFCRFASTTEEDVKYPHVTHIMEGRREVFLHILDRRGKDEPLELARAIDRMRAEAPPPRQEVADGTEGEGQP